MAKTHDGKKKKKKYETNYSHSKACLDPSSALHGAGCGVISSAPGLAGGKSSSAWPLAPSETEARCAPTYHLYLHEWAYVHTCIDMSCIYELHMCAYISALVKPLSISYMLLASYHLV